MPTKKRYSNKKKIIKRITQSVKKGGNNFGPPSFPNFDSTIEGSYYSLNRYNNDLFGLTKSSNFSGGRKQKRTTIKRKK